MAPIDYAILKVILRIAGRVVNRSEQNQMTSSDVANCLTSMVRMNPGTEDLEERTDECDHCTPLPYSALLNSFTM